MNQISNLFTIAFTIGPSRRDEFFNAWGSMSDIESSPENVILFFNPFNSKNHDVFIDMADVRTSEIFKFNHYYSLSTCWNLSVVFSQTPYIIIANDDIIFKDERCLQKTLKKHEEGHRIVHLTENWSCFSFDRTLIADVGWFDEHYSHSWEDCDYRWRMIKKSISDYRFDPHLVRHLRSASDRDESRWNTSSEWFFKKWGIAKKVYPDNPRVFDDPTNRQKLQATGFFRNANPNYFEPMETMDFYPKISEEIKKSAPVVLSELFSNS